MSSWLKRSVLSVALILGLQISGYWMYREFTGNFHTVSEGKIYRSAQLREDQWTEYIKKYHIKSILNLRGENKGSSWYLQEVHMAEAFGVKHYDVGISANHEVSDENIERILGLIREAPKPLLIHCKYGTDRSGLMAAVYRYKIEGLSAEGAVRQLSLVYGHFPYLLSTSGAMDRSFWRYVDHNRQTNSLMKNRYACCGSIWFTYLSAAILSVQLRSRLLTKIHN
jgi:protein tyrosine phosphatase (PTP) superfamily phosphohydrolase (DUF442 family)